MAAFSRLGFIGLGNMGGVLARRLLAGGASLSVVAGPQGESAKTIAALGASTAATPREAAAGSDALFTCLPSGREVEAVALGADGVLAAARPGFVHVDLTSSDPAVTARLAPLYAARGALFVDAAVSGPPEKAANGEIALVVGCDGDALARLDPLLRRIAGRIVHAGPVGAGHRTKAIMGVFGMAVATAAAEALALARAGGIDLAMLRALIGETGMNSATFQAMAAAATGEVGPPRRFTVAAAAKDARHAAELAVQASLSLELVPATRRALERALAAGLGGKYVTDLATDLNIPRGA